MMKLAAPAAACAMLALAGCSILPTYTPAPGAKTAKVDLIGFGDPYMCVKGERFKLPVETSGTAQSTFVPVGERITMWRFMTFQGYQVTSSCRPAFSIVPKEGQHLMVHSGVAAGSCFIEAVSVTPQSPTGVSRDPSLNRPEC